MSELLLEVQPSDAEVRVASGIVQGLRAFARFAENMPRGMSRQRAQSHAALDRWEILEPLLRRLRGHGVSAGELVRGIEQLAPFEFSDAAEEYLWNVLEAAPRGPEEPGMPRPRTWRALLLQLGYCAAAYLDGGRSFIAAHHNLATLISDLSIRSSERWLPILHRAAVITSYELFDELDEPRESRAGDVYDRSQAPKLYVVDTTLQLYTAIRLTLDERAGKKAPAVHARIRAGATLTAGSSNNAVATPTDRLSHVSGKSREVVDLTGLASAEEPALPAEGAPDGAEDPGRPRAPLTGAAPVPVAEPTPEASSTSATGSEGSGSPVNLEDYAPGGRVWSERYRRLTGSDAPPPPMPAALKQLSLDIDARERHRDREWRRALVPDESEDLRWLRQVHSCLTEMRVQLPEARAGEVAEVLRQMCGTHPPDEAATAVLKLLRAPRAKRSAPALPREEVQAALPSNVN